MFTITQENNVKLATLESDPDMDFLFQEPLWNRSAAPESSLLHFLAEDVVDPYTHAYLDPQCGCPKELAEIPDVTLWDDWNVPSPTPEAVMKLARDYGILFEQELYYSRAGKPGWFESLQRWQAFLQGFTLLIHLEYARDAGPGDLALWETELQETWGAFKSNAPDFQGKVNIYQQHILDILWAEVGPAKTRAAASPPTLTMIPEQLCAALLLRWMRFISDGGRFSRCHQCFRHFARSGHKDRMYCSHACKQAAFRSRKQSTV